MNALRKGIALGVLQSALVLSLTGKLFYDRATSPRVWVKTHRFDPNMPIRGRYLSLQLAPETSAAYFDRMDHQRVVFFVPERPPDLESSLFRGPELWAEVSIPRKGPPRPIRLGIKKDGQFQPAPGL